MLVIKIDIKRIQALKLFDVNDSLWRFFFCNVYIYIGTLTFKTPVIACWDFFLFLLLYYGNILDRNNQPQDPCYSRVIRDLFK